MNLASTYNNTFPEHEKPTAIEVARNLATPLSPNHALWEKGDFTAIAAFMRESGETVVRSLGLTPPLRVLDLG